MKYQDFINSLTDEEREAYFKRNSKISGIRVFDHETGREITDEAELKRRNEEANKKREAKMKEISGPR